MSVVEARVRWPRPVLIAEAKALFAQGYSKQEAAVILGVKYGTLRTALSDPDGSQQRARRDSYSGTCIDCGAPTQSDGTSNPSPRCRLCAPDANRKWTREGVIEVIQEFARIHGRPPVSSEWLKGLTEPRLTVGTVQTLFGSWSAGIEAAGFPRPHKGHKQLANGRGVGLKMRTYYVLHKNGDSAFHAVTTEAHSPEQAIEKVADSEGEWIAILDRYWIKATVATQTKLAVIKTRR